MRYDKSGGGGQVKTIRGRAAGVFAMQLYILYGGSTKNKFQMPYSLFDLSEL